VALGVESERNQKVSSVDIEVKNLPDGKNSKCKGPEAGRACLLSKKSKEGSLAAEMLEREEEVRAER
jgi:hypothetical protein